MHVNIKIRWNENATANWLGPIGHIPDLIWSLKEVSRVQGGLRQMHPLNEDIVAYISGFQLIDLIYVDYIV